MQSNRLPKVGIVCGGGGDVGVAFAAGCLAALADETGWDPRQAAAVVGTSAGSLAGTALRVGISADDYYAAMVGDPVSPAAARRLTSDVLGSENDGLLPPLAEDALTNARLSGSGLVTTTAARPHRARPIALAAAIAPEGRFCHTFVRNKIVALAGEGEWPESKLMITATRMDTGRRTVFTRDSEIRTDLPTAVAASCAIPSVFNPVTVDGIKFVDGGIQSSTNADLLIRQGLDAVIIISPLSCDSPFVRTRTGPMRTAMRAITTREQERLKAAGVRVLTFNPDLKTIQAMGLNIMDVGKRPSVAQASRAAAEQLLESEVAAPVADLLRARTNRTRLVG